MSLHVCEYVHVSVCIRACVSVCACVSVHAHTHICFPALPHVWGDDSEEPGVHWAGGLVCPAAPVGRLLGLSETLQPLGVLGNDVTDPLFKPVLGLYEAVL